MPKAVSSPRIGRSMAHLSVPPVPEAPADQSLKEAATAAANADVAVSAKACAAASQLEPSLAPSPRRSLRSPQAFQACDAPAAEAPASKTQTGRPIISGLMHRMSPYAASLCSSTWTSLTHRAQPKSRGALVSITYL